MAKALGVSVGQFTEGLEGPHEEEPPPPEQPRRHQKGKTS
jgi:hypothetical protein